MEYYIIIGVVGIVVLLVTVALVAHHVGKGKVESQLAIANKEKELLGQRLAELKEISTRVLADQKDEVIVRRNSRCRNATRHS